MRTVLEQDLYNALKKIMGMIDEGKLVRDIHRDSIFESFFEQSKELIIALTNANIAIRKFEDGKE